MLITLFKDFLPALIVFDFLFWGGFDKQVRNLSNTIYKLNSNNYLFDLLFHVTVQPSLFPFAI